MELSPICGDILSTGDTMRSRGGTIWGQRRRFTPECKCQAVQLLDAGQRSEAEIAREFDIRTLVSTVAEIG